MKLISRREFIKGSTALGALACCTAGLGIGRPQLAFGQYLGSGQCSNNTVVMFNLFGGACHLNSFAIPRERGSYYDIRGSIAIPGAQSLPMADGFGLHPVLQNLYSLYLQGDVCLFPTIAEPVGSRSHFTAQQFMSLADGSINADNSGWVGAVSEQLCNSRKESNNTFNFRFDTMGLGVGSQRDFQTSAKDGSSDCSNPVVIPGINGYSFIIDGGGGSLESALQEEIAKKLLEHSSLDQKNQIQKLSAESSKSVYDEVSEIKKISTDYAPIETYQNNRAGTYFRDVSSMVRSCIGVKLTYGGMGGWDNHSNMGGVSGTQANLLSQFDSALGSFYSEMSQSNLWQNVIIIVFTEFGRTNRANTSLGTDHGHAGAILLIGGAVRRVIHGALPTDLDLTNSRNRLIPTADYREAYYPALEWAGIDAERVFKNYTPANRYSILKA